jgi:1-acyl-sn-glycerol-3-phosphate acyltransferase
MFYVIMRNILYPFIRLFLRVKVSGKENIPTKGGYIICANHTSIADMFAIAVPFNCQIRYMAKEELFKTAFTRWLFGALGTFAVQRGKGDLDAIKKACEVLNGGGVFGIFPEGTRTKAEDGTPGKAKTGAALITMKTKASVLPVSIRYSTGQAKLFCRVQINIGELIEYEEPKEEQTMRSELRTVTEKIMGKVLNLWEMKD